MTEPIFSVCYDCLRGVDFSFYSTKEKSLRAASRHIVENIVDVHDADVQNSILTSIATFNYEDAITTWTEWQSNRTPAVVWLTLAELPVDKDIPDARALRDTAKDLLKEQHESTANTAEKRLPPRGA